MTSFCSYQKLQLEWVACLELLGLCITLMYEMEDAGVMYQVFQQPKVIIKGQIWCQIGVMIRITK